jgi:bifunctional non-homologous end joining protein LigD
MRIAVAGADFIEPCLPSPVAKPPKGSTWLHEIKHDGYRMMVRKDKRGISVFTRRGHDWTDRFPAIVNAACKLKPKSFLIDGEAVCIGDHGIPQLELMRRRRHYSSVFLYAFDLLQLDGIDLRKAPIEDRKGELACMLPLMMGGIQFNEDIEGDAKTVLEHACKLGLEGIVSKRKGSPYVSGRSNHWIKLKNPDSPAVKRETEEDWRRSTSALML